MTFIHTPDNSVWYNIERGDDEAAKIVFRIINKHEMRQDGEPFASFILRTLQDMISDEQPQSAKADKPKEQPSTPEVARSKPDDLNAKIKAALGRHSAGRRQWSNQHSRPRR